MLLSVVVFHITGCNIHSFQIQCLTHRIRPSLQTTCHTNKKSKYFRNISKTCLKVTEFAEISLSAQK